MDFMGKDFLLESNTAKTLYHDVAAKMPIIDYHCHIDAGEILKNKKFESLSEAWLGGDHYKWRLMRANGTPEKFITGDAPGLDKFTALSQVLPRAIGNPVYHWAHLELQRFFDCDKPLNPDSAKEIWDLCDEKIKTDDALRVRGIIESMNVEVIVTTDDPADSLENHIALAKDDSFKTKVLPAWRPNFLMNVDSDGFADYIVRLSNVSGVKVDDLKTLKTALLKRLEFFNDCGCRASDHGLQQLIYAPASEDQINTLFKKRLGGEMLTTSEKEQYLYALMVFLGKEYARLGWVMELHVGVRRNTNSVMFKKLGADTGFDCVDPASGVTGLAEFLDELNNAGALPKTLLFPINPNDNLAISTLAGCFAQDDIKGKVQQGSAWWYNDTLYGMEQQMLYFAESSVLANFVGMLTDSRSFMSYTRHEYFRRLLCNMIGKWVESGQYPADMAYLKTLVEDICYKNAKTYFGY